MSHQERVFIVGRWVHIVQGVQRVGVWVHIGSPYQRWLLDGRYVGVGVAITGRVIAYRLLIQIGRARWGTRVLEHHASRAPRRIKRLLSPVDVWGPNRTEQLSHYACDS